MEIKKEMRKQFGNIKETTIGEKLKAKNLIISYIRDSYGFNRGVIVAGYNNEINDYEIGWALYDELTNPTYVPHVKLTNIPAFRNFIVKDLCSLSSKDVVMPSPVYEVRLSYAEKSQLVDLAISRLTSLNRDGYYIHFAVEYLTRNHSYISNIDNISVDSIDWFNDCNDLADIREVKSMLVCIRRSIRNMEYRAYKYFKK